MKLNTNIKVIFSATLVFALFFASYFSFANYQPKVLTEVREVKGYSTKKDGVFDLPTPRYAKSLAYDQTINSKKFTFQTDKSPSEIKEFYDVILLNDGWKIKKEGKTDDFVTSEYRKDDLLVTVWASYDADTKLTFASTEVLQLED